MHCAVLVAEIGSTTTLVNAFEGLDGLPCLLGQGQAATTVLAGDVRIGLRAAIAESLRPVNQPLIIRFNVG